MNRIKHKPHAGRRRAEKYCFLSLVTFIIDLDLQTRPREGAYVIRVKLAQIRSAVPEIFHTRTKTVTDSAKNGTLCSSLCAVKTTSHFVIIHGIRQIINKANAVMQGIYTYNSYYYYYDYYRFTAIIRDNVLAGTLSQEL